MTTQPDLKAVGRPLKIHDGREKVTGHARYTADLALPGMVHARLVLSPHAHANIKSIDVEQARQVPGVVAVLTSKDLPTRDRVATNRNSAILARDRVVFRGQPVVAVIGETEAAAQDAADLVFVDYEALPAAVDPVAAMDADAPCVWPRGIPKGDVDMSEAHAGSTDAGNEQRSDVGNIAKTVTHKRGDIERGFAESDAVTEHTYRVGIVHQGYMEPHAAVGAIDPVTDELVIYTSTQGQFMVRDEVSSILRMPKGQVRIVPMKVGGGFGAKYGIVEPLVASLALHLRRPVRLVLSRTEDFLTTTPSPACVMKLKVGAKRSGELTALQAEIVLDSGCFPSGLLGIVCLLIAGYYNIPNLDIQGYEVLTHKPQVGAYRAPTAPQATFAIESAVDELATKLDLDPLAFRLKNVVQTGDPMPDGDAWPHIGLKACLERIQEHPLWQNRTSNGNGHSRGVGLAVGGWFGGAAPAAAVCRVDSDGTVNLHVGSVDISGSNTSMIALAAEILGVKPSQVRVLSGDTKDGPFAPNSGGSQVTYTLGVAVMRAAEEARKQLLSIAADIFEASVEDLDIADGTISVKGVPAKRISVADVAAKTMKWNGKYAPVVGQGGSAITTNAPGFTAQLAEVEVDPATGEVQVTRNVIVQDVGRAINPMLIEGQVHGGATQGIGYGLWEELQYDDSGELLSASFMDYAMPAAPRVPDFEVVLVENPTPDGPMGARGIGEPSIVAGAAAIANAIAAATGVRVAELPVTAQRLWKAMHTNG